MALPDTLIHRAELLITLDYLLNHTDEKHPATQQDICRYARNFGFKYVDNAKVGNDVRRQRIGDVLKFLEVTSADFPDNFPFIMETTNSGKYYIDQKNGLHKEQIASVLAAIKNDKYTKDEDTDYLIKQVLNAFGTSEDNRQEILKEYQILVRGVKKEDKETMRKIHLINKSYKENKLIKASFNGVDYTWFKVYFAKEYKNRLHVFLLPAFKSASKRKNNFIFDAIENINIAPGKESVVLNQDEKENKDYLDCNKIFKHTNPELANKYRTLDNMIEKQIMPGDGKTCIVTFSFDLTFVDEIKRSFESFFNEEFWYQETTTDVMKYKTTIEDVLMGMDNWVVVGDEPTIDKAPTHGLANVSVNNEAFKQWLLSSLSTKDDLHIIDFVEILKPVSILKEIADYHFYELVKNAPLLSGEQLDILHGMIMECSGKKDN